MNKTDTDRSVRTARGSALILVVVVTVLLSVLGIMFLMVSRVGDMMGTAARQEYEMDQAVQTVNARIERILVQDLFGTNLNKGIIDNTPGASNEPFDAPGPADPWLASLEPKWISDSGTPNDPTDDLYQWPYISNIIYSAANFGGILGGNWDRTLRGGTGPLNHPTQPNEWGSIVPDYQDLFLYMDGSQKYRYFYVPADADGDGVADSVWVQMGQTGGGEMIYAAVRIIDNCAMLNLNTAHMTRIAFPNTVGDGKYLSHVDYEACLRGDDRSVGDVVRKARMLNATPFTSVDGFDVYHDNVIMNIENPGPSYTLFDISDELEIRNRFLLTSRVQARFEQEMRLAAAPYKYGLYQTFDFERGDYTGGWNVPLRVKRIPVEDADSFRVWKLRMNPENFDNSSPWNANPHNYKYYYDRRHVCTFYSFDRNLRWGGDPFPNTWTPAEKQQFEAIYKKVFMPADGRAVSVRGPLIPENDPNPVILAQNRFKTRQHILHLLYAFRAYFRSRGDAPAEAACKAAQIVANMIDYLDDSTANARTGPFATFLYGSQFDASPTYINSQIINRMIAEVSANLNADDPSVPFYPDTAIPSVFDFGLGTGDVVYGYERQPFFTDVYTMVNASGVQAFALEIVNPYVTAFANFTNWRLAVYPQGGGAPAAFAFPANTQIRPAISDIRPGRLVVQSGIDITSAMDNADKVTMAGGLTGAIWNADRIELQRPDPANPSQFITADKIPRNRITELLTDSVAADPTHHINMRDDTSWKFTNADSYEHQELEAPTAPALTSRLGNPNNRSLPGKGYQMPVADFSPLSADRNFFTLGDFQKVLFVGNQAVNDPNTVTSAVAGAAAEGDIRFDILRDPKLMGYICFLNREKGSLPGRININTAPTNVMAAAIPANLVDIDPATPAPTPGGDPWTYHWAALDYAKLIPSGRPFENLGDLVNKVPQFQTYADAGSPDVGETGIVDDLEERDWIISRLSNVFTTRSDVFTAYILVRLGPNGPQRRVMAIFDRSQVWTPQDRPTIVAVKTVPNPR